VVGENRREGRRQGWQCKGVRTREGERYFEAVSGTGIGDIVESDTAVYIYIYKVSSALHIELRVYCIRTACAIWKDAIRNPFLRKFPYFA